jgi:2-dehydro-3-deoxyphosphooctonate aldolase (KDO 8-P synthase)
MRIADISLGEGAPLVLIAGLNVVETEEGALEMAAALAERAQRRRMPLIFKASFDKANRSSLRSYRGLGLDEGLRILQRVKRETGLPILTDVHEPPQAKTAAEVADCLQVPAFLCRQTDLLKACAATGRPVNVKKGQFMAPQDMRHVVDKLARFGANGVLLTERGTSFGYNNLVVDFRALPVLREMAPVCFDATHAVQVPGGSEDATGGDRRYVRPLARAAVAVGVDALFVECHPEPERAPCDGPSQIDLASFDRLLDEVCAVQDALGGGAGRGA